MKKNGTEEPIFMPHRLTVINGSETLGITWQKTKIKCFVKE